MAEKMKYTRIAGRPKRRRSRQGMLTFELVYTLPILILVILAITQFCLLLMSAQAVSGAAHVGVREATLPSASTASVQSAVRRALQGWKFGDKAQVAIYVNDVPELDMPLEETITGDLVAVTVQIPSAEATPDLLKFIGLSIQDETLATTFVMRKE